MAVPFDQPLVFVCLDELSDDLACFLRVPEVRISSLYDYAEPTVPAEPGAVRLLGPRAFGEGIRQRVLPPDPPIRSR